MIIHLVNERRAYMMQLSNPQALMLLLVVLMTLVTWSQQQIQFPQSDGTAGDLATKRVSMIKLSL